MAEPLARARRVGPPTAAELDAPTLDAPLTATTIPTRRRHDGDMPRARRKRRPVPQGAEPFALTGLIFGVIAVAAGCLWPVSGAAAIVALFCGFAGLNGRSRGRAVAAVTLGAVGLAAGLGVAASSLALVAQQNAPPPLRPLPPPSVPVGAPRGVEHFLPK